MVDRIGVSVVIVTYNGVTRLKPTLEHLADQKGINFPCELILIDNNSTDDSSAFSKKKWEDLGAPFPMKIYLEPKPGTMYARKKGIEMSYYRYILYCDDDNWLNENYIVNAFRIINSNEDIAVVGGIGCMVYEKEFIPPTWLKKYKNNYGTGPQGKFDGDTTNSKGCLYSAGAIFDKKWLNRLYDSGFSSSLKGRDEKSLQAGEDTELTYALKIIGGKLYYSSRLQFKHFMPSKRLDWGYLEKLYQAFGYAGFIITPYHEISKEAFWIVDFFNKLLDSVSKILKNQTHILFSKESNVGNKRILERNKEIGRMKAILFSYSIYRENKKMVEKLKKFSHY
jgi:glycosyltransferase involved in cell wall biosynthesis